jgi:peptidoglycan/LPS O-acetylase OafA/YrhL
VLGACYLAMPGAVTSSEMSETLANPKAASAPAPKHSRLAWLDALRGFAALCVVFDHGSTLMLMPVRDFLYRWLDLGQYGVFVFFLISGYIIPASLERKGSVRGFWTSRLFRLYPMYLVALVIAAVTYETGYGTLRGAEHHPGQSVFAWLLMLPNLLTGPNVPNVTWTLSYEMVFYLLLVALFSWGVHRRSGTYATVFAVAAVALGGVLPMAALTRWAGHADHGGLALNATADALVLGGIVLAVSSRSRVARVGAAVAGLTALVLVMVNQGSPSPWEGSVILALMFTGTLIYRTQQRQPGTSRAMTAAIVVGVLALTTFAGLWHGQQRHMSHQWLIQWATSVLLAGATFGLGLAASHRRVPRWCAWLGMISFSVYLLHPLVFDAYRDVPVLHRPHTFGVQVLMFAGCVAVIIGLSAVTYYLVERPMQRLGRRLSGRGGGSGSGEPAGVTAGRSVEQESQSVEQAGQSVEQAGQSVEQAGQSVDYATGAARGAAIGSGSAATDAGSGRDTDSDRPGAPTAARSASSSSAVAGGSGASP